MTSRDINTLRELSKKKKLAKEISLADKISKQHGLATLQEVYKPVLESQETQQKELKKQTQKQEEQLTKQQQIIEEISKSQSSVAEELRKQQLVIPLIKELAKHRNIIEVIKGENDGSELTEEEKQILKELSHIDNKTLLTLINYFSVETGKDESFGTPRSDTFEQGQLADQPPEYSRVPSNIKTNFVSLGEWIFSNIIMKTKSASSDQNKKHIQRLLTDGIPLDSIKGDDIKTALKTYVEHLLSNNARVNLGEYPWSTIRVVDEDFYNIIKRVKTPPRKYTSKRMTQSLSSTPRGTGSTAFLPSDPNELINRLDILYAEKEAGNNNVLAEASAIADELRRQGVINTETLKTLSKKFVN